MLVAVVGLFGISLAGGEVSAAQINVAVAANFSEAAKEIAAVFKQRTGHEAVLSFGSSGQLYTQVTQDAPFQILLSADAARPEKAVEDGLGVADSLFTYAIGKLVLWSKNADLVKGEDTLRSGAFTKLAIANPAGAPYGAAAIETLKALQIYDTLRPKIVQGNNIAQTYQFVDTGNAELGFVALSQLAGNSSGSRWTVPQSLYAPIRQDAVLLKKGADNEAAVAFMAFLKGPDARASSRNTGTPSTRKAEAAMESLPADIWQPVRLTVQLAAIATIVLLVIGTPIAWWLARSRSWWKEGVAAIVALPLVLPPTVLGFYLLVSLGPSGPGGLVAGLWGARTLAFTFEGLVIGSVFYSLPFVVQPIRNAFEAMGDRPLEVAATQRASPARAFWTVAVPLARARVPDRRSARLRPYRRRIRHRADDRRQYSGRDQGPVGGDLRLCRDDAMARGQHPGRRHGGFRFRGHSRNDADWEACRARWRMSEPKVIRVAFRGRLGRFALDAAFTVPAIGVTGLFGPSGCGKTTVLRCIAGLQRVAEGFCAIDGDIWQDGPCFRPTHKRPIGFVFQEASLFTHLSVQGQPALCHRGRPPSAGLHRIGFDEVIDLLGLAELIDRSPRALSGGERQRVAIGRALLAQPELLLMDEPLASLDRQARDEILPFLERLHDSLSLPVIYVSHDMAEIARFADHLVLMQSGRVLAAGPLNDLQSDPSLPLAGARDAAVSLDAVIETCDAAYGLTTLRVEGGRFVVPIPPGPTGER